MTQNNANFVGNDFLSQEDSIKSYLTPNSGFFYNAQLIEKIQSDYQLVSIWNGPDLGNCLVLDDQLMCAETDEFYYHEALIYPGLVYCKNLKTNKNLDILLIGGGDGGSAKHLLKYKNINSIDWVEIDKAVIDLSRKYLPLVHANSFDSSKVNLLVGDGFDFVAKSQKHYDLIYLDLNDPIGANSVTPLYTDKFFANLSSLSKNSGITIMQIGAHLYNQGFDKAVSLANTHFKYKEVYNSFCPSYHCMNYFLVMSNFPLSHLNSIEAAKYLFESQNFDTNIMNEGYFAKMFSLPKNVIIK